MEYSDGTNVESVGCTRTPNESFVVSNDGCDCSEFKIEKKIHVPDQCVVEAAGAKLTPTAEQLRRQLSTVTQDVSNCTIRDSHGSTLKSLLFDSNSPTATPHHVSSQSGSKSFDEETHYSSTETGTSSSYTQNTSSLTYTSLSDFGSEGENRIENLVSPSLPLHVELDDIEYEYYQICYRGIVALLSAPREHAPRSGSYLSYGEIFSSRKRVGLDTRSSDVSNPSSPTLSPVSDIPLLTESYSSQTTSNPPPLPPSYRARAKEKTVLKLNRSKFLSVDKMLTGGYAIDCPTTTLDADVDLTAETPKRSNLHSADAEFFPGFVSTRWNDVVVTRRLITKPHVEECTFMYKVVSSTPIPILAGPASDAPNTKAVLLPGSLLEASLRLCLDPDGVDATVFIRLSHRRGWIADRSKGPSSNSIPVVMEVAQNHNVFDQGNLTGFSTLSTGNLSSISISRRRHRPPRRLGNASSGFEASKEKSHARQICIRSSLQSTGMVGSRLTAVNTPSSNVSMVSDDSSLDHGGNVRPDNHTETGSSTATNSSVFINNQDASTQTYYFLIRVTAPAGLKILDAPQFQVNNLIRGTHSSTASVSSSHSVTKMESSIVPPRTHNSIFQTMSGRLTTTGPSKVGNSAVFDVSSKTRILPRGVLFEASRRMEITGVFSQGAGLIKLSDNSGWAIVPRQDELDQQYRKFPGALSGVKEGEATRAYEEVGNAVITSNPNDSPLLDDIRWIRIVTRAGVRVSCAPPARLGQDTEASPSSSKGSSNGGGSNLGSSFCPTASSDSDVASSVGSSFLDAMFRTPKKKDGESFQDRKQTLSDLNGEGQLLIACGCVVEIELWSNTMPVEFVRLRGGQGWVPLTVANKITAVSVLQPTIRRGSFWFRVQSLRGIKVRTGPSVKAPSIKSDSGEHFRFECGEFLRASEVMTILGDDGNETECFAKLYRNRHVQLQAENRDYASLASITSLAEWVQVQSFKEVFLEEYANEPRIERHKQGWRYNVVPDDGIEVRKGPSFSSEKTGIILFGGETIVINERMSPHGDKITWLRMKDGQGWVYDVDNEGRSAMIPFSLRYRTHLNGRQRRSEEDSHDIAYEAIVARLFHNSESFELKSPSGIDA